MKSIALALALGLAGCGPGDAQEAKLKADEVQATLPGRVVDQAQVLDAKREQALESRLARLERLTTDQMVVVSVMTLGGKTADQFAWDFGNRWGLGKQDKDNGVVMVVAPAERKLWVAVGLGLEGLLTKDRTQGIVDRMLIDFKRGDLPAGIERGVGEIEQALLADRHRPQRAAEAPRKKAA